MGLPIRQSTILVTNYLGITTCCQYIRKAFSPFPPLGNKLASLCPQWRRWTFKKITHKSLSFKLQKNKGLSSVVYGNYLKSLREVLTYQTLWSRLSLITNRNQIILSIEKFFISLLVQCGPSVWKEWWVHYQQGKLLITNCRLRRPPPSSSSKTPSNTISPMGFFNL